MSQTRKPFRRLLLRAPKHHSTVQRQRSTEAPGSPQIGRLQEHATLSKQMKSGGRAHHLLRLQRACKMGREGVRSVQTQCRASACSTHGQIPLSYRYCPERDKAILWNKVQSTG